MRKQFLPRIALYLAFFLFVLLAVHFQVNASAPGIVILYTNDVHCAVDGDIGYAGLAALKKQYIADGANVLLLDAGDAIQGQPIGTVSEGGYLIDIMREVGYDAAVPGNHEFDYGTDRFFELAREAGFPYLSCNFTLLATGEPVFSAGTVLETGNVKIGVVGVTTPKTLTSSTPIYFQDGSGNFLYGFCQDATGEKLYRAVQDAVDGVIEDGAEYVILLSHLGITADASPYTSSEVITHTRGVDAVLDGHSHSVIECERVKNADGKSVLLSSTGTALYSVGALKISRDGSLSAKLITAVPEKDAGMEAYIESLLSEFQAALDQVVAASEVELTVNEPGTDVRIVRTAETNLGDLCADAYRYIGQADIGIANGGGVRTGISAGDVTLGEMIAVNPFGNNLCVIEASGQEILDALELGCRALPEESGGFLQVSGLSYTIDVSVPTPVVLDENGMFSSVEGVRRVQNVFIGGEAICPEKTYTVAGFDYLLQNGGNGYTMFQDNAVLQKATELDYQALIRYVEEVLSGVIGAEYADPYGAARIVAIEK